MLHAPKYIACSCHFPCDFLHVDKIATVLHLDLASPGYVPNYGTTRLSDVQRLHTLERLVEILTGSESRPVSLSLNVSHFNSARSVSCMMDWRDVDRQQLVV